MKTPRRYPNIALQSKNELAKRIGHKKFPKDDAQNLINDVILNHRAYYRDSKKHSQPDKGKYVRNAKGTPLGFLLKKINEQVLAPYDHLLPPYIFGGIQGSNHLMAAEHLLGERRERTLLALDITKFFEQVSSERVRDFLRHKAGCTDRAALLISNICCVNDGPKGSPLPRKSLGRGFATSSRLAIWCNLDTFIALSRLIEKRLKGHDPRIAIYVDDIGVTASRVPRDKLEALGDEIGLLLEKFDTNQSLPENKKKRRIVTHQEGIIHLGVAMGRNSLSISPKTRSKLDRAKKRYKATASTDQRKKEKKRYQALKKYQAQVNAVGR